MREHEDKREGEKCLNVGAEEQESNRMLQTFSSKAPHLSEIRVCRN